MIELVWSATRVEDQSTANMFQSRLHEFEVANGLRYEITPVDSQGSRTPSDMIISENSSLGQVLREVGLLDGQTLWCQALVARERGQVLYSWSLDTAFGPPASKGIDGVMLSYSTEGTARLQLKGKLQETNPLIVNAYRVMEEVSENSPDHATAIRIFRGLFIDAAGWTHNAVRHRRILYLQNPNAAGRRF